MGFFFWLYESFVWLFGGRKPKKLPFEGDKVDVADLRCQPPQHVIDLQTGHETQFIQQLKDEFHKKKHKKKHRHRQERLDLDTGEIYGEVDAAEIIDAAGNAISAIADIVEEKMEDRVDPAAESGYQSSDSGSDNSSSPSSDSSSGSDYSSSSDYSSGTDSSFDSGSSDTGGGGDF